MKELETIEGIGPKTKELLNKIKIYTVEDLLNYYPYRYDIIKRSDLSNLSDGDKIIIDGIVEGQPTTIYINKSLKKMIFRISTKTMILNITLYNRAHLYSDLKSGKEITIIGKYNKLKNTVIVSDIRFGLLPPSAKIEPIYYTTEGLTVKQISKFEAIALENDYDVIDLVPRYIEEKYNLMNKKSAIKNIHVPEDILLLKKARQRIKYEELFMYVLKINYLKNKINNDNLAIERNIDKDKLDKFIKSLPFELTLDQDKAVNDIINDLSIKKRMNRLLQGDVGSGKTIIALIAVYANYLSKYQSALMAPTEILAVQHYEEAKKIFSKYKLNIALLTSSTSNKDKKTIYEELENGKIDLIIGTQALIQENVKYKKLGLVITDEQHRFGVNQRDTFKSKGISPDVLSMSATPIPRTYALTIYGDTDVSSIKSKPKGRKEIITVFKKEKDITDVLEMMKKELELNHQIYVVAPMIDTESDSEKESVYDLEEKMNKAFGKISKIGIIHGKLDPKDKDKVMKDFEKNKINILISTTVIEVGVNVPNASMIVIFNANMFGLSTLHQLRGRVGRGDTQSYCVLVAKESEERLRFLENTSDGFEISEYDFQTRGEGDLFGTRQSGELGLKMANIKRDFKMLLKAKEDADEFINMLLTFETNPEFGPILEELKKVDTLD
ncbi:MAG: ATP-dependent DNA helicase RecG [Firmicutes bacterium]|nr:ATP-dependent DNA helicase RecG [Bacillota bacterium]MDY5335867.1 ATP-dependent DNA helicase RecG [Bacilli bacterium]